MDGSNTVSWTRIQSSGRQSWRRVNSQMSQVSYDSIQFDKVAVCRIWFLWMKLYQHTVFLNGTHLATLWTTNLCIHFMLETPTGRSNSKIDQCRIVQHVHSLSPPAKSSCSLSCNCKPNIDMKECNSPIPFSQISSSCGVSKISNSSHPTQGLHLWRHVRYRTVNWMNDEQPLRVQNNWLTRTDQ